MEPQDERQQSALTDVGAQIDIRKYWMVLTKRKWIIIATAIVVAAASTAWSMRQPKVYTTSSTVIIDPGAPKALGKSVSEVVELGAGNFWGNEDYYNTQYRIIKSESLALKVVRKYHLELDKRIIPIPPPGATQEQLESAAANFIRSKISVAPLKGSRVVAITATDTNQKLVADLANDVASVFIDQNLDVKLDATRIAKKWVAKQLDEARTNVSTTETGLYTFKKDNNILSVALEDRQNMLAKALEEMSDALTAATKSRITLQSRRKAIAQLIATEALSAPGGSLDEAGGSGSALAALRGTYLTARRDLVALEQKYGPKHPSVVELKARVDATLEDLKTEGQTMLRATDAEIGALQDSERRFAAELARLTSEALEVNKKEIDYKRLNRDQQNSVDIYKMLLQRYNESGLEERDQANNIRQLDLAHEPGGPIGPNRQHSMTLGLMLGLALGLGLAFFIEFLDRTVKSQEDIEVAVGLPFLGIVPSVEEGASPARGNGRDLHIVRYPTSTAAECCRVLRTNILFSSADKPLKTLVVTSSSPVEGKTTTVVNLGVVMAQSGHRTLIIDTDMRRPRLHKVLGTTNEIGVSSVIVGEADVDAAIKATEVPGLFLLPCGPIPPNPSELLATEKFAALARKLAEKFDRLIFDSPPTLAVTDAAVLSRVADGTILVVRAGRTTRDAMLRAKHSLAAVNTNIIGVVLNDVNLKNPHYSSYYNYYNYKYQDAAPAGPLPPPQ